MVEEKIITLVGIDYIVSSDGHIYSTHNRGQGKYHKEISQRKNHDGYMEVTVGKNGHRRKGRVARIVATAFVDNPLNLPEVDHINNIRTDDRAENLQWISHEDNIKKIPFETQSKAKRGIHNGRATFTEDQIREIRKLYDDGMPIYEIAEKYNSKWSTINNIIIRHTWKHVE